jgi:hypothetical protein
MAVRKTHDIAVVVGSYTKNGETKNRYQNVGVMMQGDKGPFIILERFFNPAGVPHDASKGNSIMLSCFEPRPANGSPSSGNDEDIPF